MTTARLYLLDVEGTTSPVSLVYEQLFPYARRRMGAFLREQVREPWIDSEIADDLELLANERAAESAGSDGTGSEVPVLNVPTDGASWEAHVGEAEAYLLWLMDRDRKSTALKAIQGRVWRAGFEGGELVGTVFPDVPPALARWSRTAKVAIYSSGSVEAQQLLFRYSSAGDLTGFITSYFDTRVGPKTSPASYRAIAEQMQVAPGEIVFVSDLLRELDPALEAGCQTWLSVRDGNAPVADVHGHATLGTLADIEG
jgi:enolase-phosphatase E1